jgi:hypothetical protein
MQRDAPPENRQNTRPDAGSAPNRQATPPDRTVPRPPAARPEKEEKPKDHDKDNKPK